MNEALSLLRDARVLVTGAAGSIGVELVQALESEQIEVWATDVDSMNVLDITAAFRVFTKFRPTVVFHLAGAKHAPLGEEDPWEAAQVNISGTQNVLTHAAAGGAKVVTASTCKACNPETAYGATKLIAERMTLNAGGAVARFYNVRGSSGNVFELWGNLPQNAPLPVTPCRRRFMSMHQAVRLLLWAALLPSGRYSVTGTKSETISDVASDVYPGRPIVWIPPRRGDRLEEPEMAVQETAVVVSPTVGIALISSPHDQAAVPEAVAA